MTKGGQRGNGTQPADAEAAEARLNNFLNSGQRSAATRSYRRRSVWHHGPDWEKGPTGMRMRQCIEALPRAIVDQMRDDMFGAFAAEATRWSLSAIMRAHADQTARGVLRAMSAVEIFHKATGIAPLYAASWVRGTLHMERAGVPFADLPLESEEQWEAAYAAMNPTGTLDQAPPGALRILCLCTSGMATGTELRLRTERILTGWGIAAWLETRAAFEAQPRAQFADVILVTKDDEDDARALHGPCLVVVENWLDHWEIRRELAKLPAVIAQRGTSRLTASPTPRTVSPP